MWIVRLALKRPYTFVVMSMLIVILGIATILRMPTDIFPDIDIPVISVIWNYTGLPPEEMEKRIVTNYERVLSATVNDIEHIESQSLTGVAVVKIFFQPGARIEAATAQVTAVSQSMVRQMPPGTTPPFIIRHSASNVPIMQAALESDSLSEQQLFDFGTNFIRPDIVTIPGAMLPWPYGGKQRQIMVDVDPPRLFAWGLSPRDVTAAIAAQNVILPTGTAKMGTNEYPVLMNSSPELIRDIGDLPVKTVGATVVYVHDVASVRDGYAPQTNMVHVEGHRSVLMSILENGNASTLDIAARVRAMLPNLASKLPKELKVTLLCDQSVFVRASVEGVAKEAVIAAGLTALMILLFLGSWRATLVVVVSIPLSILVSIMVLYALGQALNVMTLGGMSLAVGILVDDATVEIENIHRNLAKKKPLLQAILDGAQEIAVPAFVATSSRQITIPRVQVVAPVLACSDRALSLPGSVQPLEETVVYPRASGYVRRWVVDLGDKVKEGDLLAEIDTPDLDQQLVQARAQLAQADAGVVQAQANARFSKMNLARYKELAPAGLASQQALEKQRAQAEVDEAIVAVARASVGSQRANVQLLTQLKSFSRVVAPFPGTVTARSVERGALVSAGTASALFKIAALDPMRVFVQVPQDVAPSVRSDVAATVTLREYPGRAFEGRVARSAGALDPTTRTMTTEVRVPNPKGELMAGMYAQVSITLPTPHRALAVPATALLNDAGGQRVAVVGAGDRIRLVPVVVERDTGPTIEIASGLVGDERIVRLPSPELTEGRVVEVAP